MAPTACKVMQLRLPSRTALDPSLGRRNRPAQEVQTDATARLTGEPSCKDGAVFSALDLEGSTLSIAEPQAFGFLGAVPGKIMVDHSVLELQPEKLQPEKALSLVGGTLT